MIIFHVDVCSHDLRCPSIFPWLTCRAPRSQRPRQVGHDHIPTCVHTQADQYTGGFQVEKEENYEFLLSFIPLFPATPTAKECQVGHGSVARESSTKTMP